MPNPINFSVAAAQRSGSFQFGPTAYPGGYTSMSYQLVGMGTGPGSDYENPANGYQAETDYSLDGGNTWSQYDKSTWTGGPQTFKGQTDPPPTLTVDLTNLPANSQIRVVVTLTGTFTIGIGNGVIQ